MPIWGPNSVPIDSRAVLILIAAQHRRLFRYLGEGDTLEEARRPAPNPGRMSPLVDGSISDRIVRFACR